MVRSRVHPEKLNIQHMGQPGQGVPVGRIEGGKCPPDAVRLQTLPNVRIVDEVLAVVETDKIMVAHLPKDGKRCKDEKQTDQNPLFTSHVGWVQRMFPKHFGQPVLKPGREGTEGYQIPI